MKKHNCELTDKEGKISIKLALTIDEIVFLANVVDYNLAEIVLWRAETNDQD